ncbi:REP element-mobilizing transposase RayT [Aquimarina sp. MAR_2010_214]|uniref:transposase n=1 Tax=Aquimarina sp. MAR_2010_214 TaxID=1250026 RepID=UPI000C6FF418|nr:transposase [Aquimarina sp. MAR_2010_214]PKV48710.1 REP element-mobilizing transposase RayT [Aquimarina sp. MAR_2010_214]
MKYEPLVSDTYFHIYNRGNNKEDIFKEERNYKYFLSLLDKYCNDICEVYAYCLLKNHFHLVIKTNTDVEGRLISQKFSNMFNTYVKAINKVYDRNGSLFKDRFLRKKIDNEVYLKQLIIYVHLNPEHHRMALDFREYPFSSYQSFLSSKHSRLSREFILSLFGGISNFEYVHLNKKVKIEKRYTLE